MCNILQINIETKQNQQTAIGNSWDDKLPLISLGELKIERRKEQQEATVFILKGPAFFFGVVWLQ